MRYLVTTNHHTPFFTAWFDPENHFNPNPEVGMVVFDLQTEMFTTDGHNWREIQKDSL